MAKQLVIRQDGVVEHMHDDAVSAVTSKLGDVTIRRASHVEPTDELSDRAVEELASRTTGATRSTIDDEGASRRWLQTTYPGKWWADLHPSGGPVVGPFDTRDAALAYEHQWVETYRLGVPDVPGNRSPDGPSA